MLTRIAITALLCFLCLSPAARATVTPDDLGEGSGLFWQALDEMGLQWNEVRFDMQDLGFYNRDKYRPHLLEVFMDNPWKMSPYSHLFTDSLLNGQGHLANTVTSCQNRINQGVRVTLIGNPLADCEAQVTEYGDENLAVALGALTGRSAGDFLTEEYAAIPADVRDAAALYCFTLPEVLDLRWTAVAEPIYNLGYDPLETFDLCVDWAIELPGEEESTRYTRECAVQVEAMMDNIDFPRLNTGGTLLALCVEQMANGLAESDSLATEFHYEAETLYGNLVLSGGGEDTYPAGGSYILILDTGGDDYYCQCGGTTSWQNGVSTILDLGGDDMYENYKDTDYSLTKYYDVDHADYTGEDYAVCSVPACGAGVLGYGILYDVAGDDWYSAQFIGQGCGVFGNGILCDRAGDDIYRGIGSVQGSGWMGTGLLVDSAGTDDYELYRYGQGFGFTNGVGVLIDVTGDDYYVANNTDIVYDGPHSPVINLNLAQGFGYGRRDDYGEGHSWGGGVGILVDGAGNDVYDCGIYALGCSYWLSVGILADKGGDDQYMSAHYTLGAPPHYSCGVFLDDAGNDKYYGYLRQAIGHGRDWSLGWFEDGAGDDWYQGGHQSMGEGNIQSIGVFWEKGGNDTYLLHNQGFGMVSPTNTPDSLRYYQLTLGMFIDGGGQDRYLKVPEELPFTGDEDELEPFEECGDGMVWNRSANQPCPNAYSVGIDAE